MKKRSNNCEVTDYNEIYGYIMPICFDIDLKNPSALLKENAGVNLSMFCKIVSLYFNVNIDDVCVIDRTREDKISYHIRIKNYNIEKVEFKYLLNDFIQCTKRVYECSFENAQLVKLNQIFESKRLAVVSTNEKPKSLRSFNLKQML